MQVYGSWHNPTEDALRRHVGPSLLETATLVRLPGCDCWLKLSWKFPAAPSRSARLRDQPKWSIAHLPMRPHLRIGIVTFG